MSLDDLLPQPRTRDDETGRQLLTGTILDTATALTDLVRVRLDDDPGQYVGPMTFVPGAVMPQTGDRCLVAFTDRAEPWVVAWETEETAPGGGGPTGPAGGVLSGTYPDPGFAADMATQAELNAEQDAREAADTDLVGDIAAEAGARAAADTNEATVRAAADVALDGRLDAIEGNYQPLDSDLTAIAALSTTAFGRALLALADAAAGRTALGLDSEAWREVGAGGQPAFENSWVNFNAAGGTYHTAAFYKDPLGRVHLRGSVKSGTIGAAAFTLPAGYRPLARLGPRDTDASYIEIQPDGKVVLGGSNTYRALDGISFRAEQ